MLYYADESHVCTNGYVPYGWQFKNENVYIPSEKAARLNFFGMITNRNQYTRALPHKNPSMATRSWIILICSLLK